MRVDVGTPWTGIAHYGKREMVKQTETKRTERYWYMLSLSGDLWSGYLWLELTVWVSSKNFHCIKTSECLVNDTTTFLRMVVRTKTEKDEMNQGCT